MPSSSSATEEEAADWARNRRSRGQPPGFHLDHSCAAVVPRALDQVRIFFRYPCQVGRRSSLYCRRVRMPCANRVEQDLGGGSRGGGIRRRANRLLIKSPVRY